MNTKKISTKTIPKIGRKNILTKVILLAIIAFVFLQKDFHIQFNLKSPLTSQSNHKEEKSKNPPPEKTKWEAMATSLLGSKQGGEKQKEVFVEIPQLRDIPEKKIQAYIKRFSNVAISENRRFGIPASIILASALYHSAAGETPLSQGANNHFDIFCNTNWEGENITFNQKCFKKYESAWSSFRDNSKHIINHFQHLSKIENGNYKEWAKGLQKGKYSIKKSFEKQIIQIIQNYQLNQFDIK